MDNSRNAPRGHPWGRYGVNGGAPVVDVCLPSTLLSIQLKQQQHLQQQILLQQYQVQQQQLAQQHEKQLQVRERKEKKKLYNILMSFHHFLLRIITIIIVWFRRCSLLSAVTFKQTVTKKNLVQLVYYFILLYCRHFVASSCYVYSIFVSFLLRGRNFWNRRRRWRRKRGWNANGTRKSDCSLSRIKRNGNRALLRHPKSSRNFRWVE